MPVRRKAKLRFYISRPLGFLLATWAVITAMMVFVGFFTVQRYSESLLFGSIRASVFSPKYLSTYEDEELRFAFENPNSSAATVTFGLENNSTFPGFLGLQESNTIYSGTLQSRQQINRQAKMFFHADISRLGELSTQVSRLGLWGSVDGLPLEKKDLEIYFAPIPLARSLSNYLGTMFLGLLGLLFRELWDQLKQTDRKKQ